MMRLLALGGGLMLALGHLPAAAQAPTDGAKLYSRCAACHTKTGAGVPGAFPPLGADFRALAAKPDGRRYLALVVIRGVMGPITVEGKPYRGVMPAQAGLSDGDVAAVLNYVGTQIALKGPNFRAFTLAEVAAVRADASGISAADVAKLHAKAGGR